MKTVLTIDDSRVVRSMVAHGLSAFGCAVIEAANGREGVDAARQHRPDLVLLDVTMPVMDGRAALAELRSDAETRATPVILLTTEEGSDLVAEIAALGVSGCLAKPFQAQTLAREVSKVLGKPAVTTTPRGGSREAASRPGAER
jgi:two-component system chemotaxis response regulator CheY